MNDFDSACASVLGGHLSARGIDLVQVNVGLRCNQACAHCHLGASPDRAEEMSPETMAQVLRLTGELRPRLVDVTGGAPELHPGLRGFLRALRAAGHPAQVRTNLTALLEPECEDLPSFFAEQGVRLVASLPCYLEENVDSQRGRGVYRQSIEALRRLNAAGYGARPGLPRDLVYNPGGPSLPPGQSGLEGDYRRELRLRHGVEFTRLLTITNLPVGRFAERLRAEGRDAAYRRALRAAFNPATVPGLMCRSQVEIAWDGRIFDCDFNLALGLPVNHGAPDHVSCFDAAALAGRRIVTGEHCFGCTAGAGSSCAGAIACGE
jgi:radical SAM/Cys-rich protein